MLRQQILLIAFYLLVELVNSPLRRFSAGSTAVFSRSAAYFTEAADIFILQLLERSQLARIIRETIPRARIAGGQ